MRTRILVLFTLIATTVAALACNLRRPRAAQPAPTLNGVIAYGMIADYGRNRRYRTNTGVEEQKRQS
jgi:hypothetical protein